ncbi:MAG: preprotein translocase subunit SecG [Prevotella sp.]|nr:preprotein translocase subunit SecG [Prevotella sp.]
MYPFFVVLIVLVSVLMIGIVLIQESKGGGLSSNFSSSNAIMGVRKTTDFVEKATWGLAACMVVFSIICAYTAPQASADQSVLEKTATETQTTNPTNTQGFQAAPAQGATQGTQGAAQQGAKAPSAASKAPMAPTTPAK